MIDFNHIPQVPHAQRICIFVNHALTTANFNFCSRSPLYENTLFLSLT